MFKEDAEPGTVKCYNAKYRGLSFYKTPANFITQFALGFRFSVLLRYLGDDLPLNN